MALGPLPISRTSPTKLVTPPIVEIPIPVERANPRALEIDAAMFLP